MAPITKREEGFALPFTIFLVTLITIMLAAAFTRATSEHEIAGSSEAVNSALAVAQSGLSRYFDFPFATRPASGDADTFFLADGFAVVTPELMRNPADSSADWTYIIRSQGNLIYPNQGAEVQAARTIAQFAIWQTGSVAPLAAWTGVSGIQRVTGGNLLVHGGDDFCGTATSLPYIRIPVQLWDYDVDDSFGSMPAVMAGTPADLGLASGVLWSTILAGNFEADYAHLEPWDLTYPSQLHIGDTTLTGEFGYGLLIVTGDLDITGAFAGWRGLILVGGQLRFEANDTWIYGSVISGLNEIDPAVGQSLMGGQNAGVDRNLWLYYSPCEVETALADLTGFVPVSNTFVDNWAEY